MKVTKESLIAAGACYKENEINALPIPSDGATPRQVAEYDIIPTLDRLWALCRAIICSSEQETAHYKRQLQLFAVYCAEDAMNNEIAAGRQPHKDSLEAVEITKKYLNGEATKEELRIAIDKAYHAALVAYYAANEAWTAYRAADAAYSAAYYAASAASRAADAAVRAAYSVAYYAADNDPVKLQKYLDKLLEMLEDLK
jgi:hypothetical protein